MKLRSRLLEYPYTLSISEKVIERRFESDPNDFLSKSIIAESVALASLKEHKMQVLKKYS